MLPKMHSYNLASFARRLGTQGSSISVTGTTLSITANVFVRKCYVRPRDIVQDQILLLSAPIHKRLFRIPHGESFGLPIPPEKKHLRE